MGQPTQRGQPTVARRAGLARTWTPEKAEAPLLAWETRIEVECFNTGLEKLWERYGIRYNGFTIDEDEAGNPIYLYRVRYDKREQARALYRQWYDRRHRLDFLLRLFRRR